MSQFDVINRNIKHQAQVSTNDMLLLMNVDNLQHAQGKDWYEAIEGMTQEAFLSALANFIHISKFTGKGVEKMLRNVK